MIGSLSFIYQLSMSKDSNEALTGKNLKEFKELGVPPIDYVRNSLSRKTIREA